MIYMHNRIVSINTMGTNKPDLTPEFCEALGRAIMWGLPEPSTTTADTIDSVTVILQRKDANVRFHDVQQETKDGCGYPTPILTYNVRKALEPIEKRQRLVMGVVQYSDGTWGLHT
jgi:hypothetical protein